jgi:hypothetical protein
LADWFGPSGTPLVPGKPGVPLSGPPSTSGSNTPLTETFTSVPLLPWELLGIEGAELDDDEEEELGIDGIELPGSDAEDELEDDEGLGSEGVEGMLLLEELLGIEGADGMLLEEELGIEGAELDEGDEELGIEGIELLLELLLVWLDWQAVSNSPSAEAVTSARSVAGNGPCSVALRVVCGIGVLMFLSLITSSSQCPCIRGLRVSGLVRSKVPGWLSSDFRGRRSTPRQ